MLMRNSNTGVLEVYDILRGKYHHVGRRDGAGHWF